MRGGSIGEGRHVAIYTSVQIVLLNRITQVTHVTLVCKQGCKVVILCSFRAQM